MNENLENSQSDMENNATDAKTKKKATGTAALTIGIIAFIFSFIPVLGGILALVGLILGLIGLAKDEKKVKSIFGTIFSVVALVASIIWIVVLFDFFTVTSREVEDTYTDFMDNLREADRIEVVESGTRSIYSGADLNMYVLDFDSKYDTGNFMNSIKDADINHNFIKDEFTIDFNNANQFKKIILEDDYMSFDGDYVKIID